MKIVSLLPSATEMVCLLGLGDQLVGVSHECDYPIGVANLPRVTKTILSDDASSRLIDEQVRQQLHSQQALYTLDHCLLERLQPDLIVTQAICDVCAVSDAEVSKVASALNADPTVVNLKPESLADTVACIRQIAVAADCWARGEAVIAALHERIEAVGRRSESIEIAARPRVILLEWIDPLFSAGHWNPEIVSIAGGIEMIGKAGERSVATSWETIVDQDPDVMVIACCGFAPQRALQDFAILQKKPGWQSLGCVRSRSVYLMDGSAYFNRPGPRLVDSLELLAHTLHPTIHQLPSYLTPAAQVVE